MRRLILAVLAALAAGPGAAQSTYVPLTLPPGGALACGGGICGAEALSPWFEDLERLQAGAQLKVHVVQIGDSHTAGDVIPGAVRSRLQARFGRGGRGYLAPGVPHDGYAPRQVLVTTANWEWAPRAGRIGGYRTAVATGLFGGPARVLAGSTMTLALDPEAETAGVGLCGRDGRWAIESEGQTVAELELFGPQCRTATLERPARSVTVWALSGGALDGVWLEGAGPGVILTSVGQVGATLADLSARDEAVVRAELAPWRPDLVILAFGTNEGFDDDLDVPMLEGTLRDEIARMRGVAPGAAILILGAPDALRRGEEGACEQAPERGPPRNLARVRDLQRRVAAEAGVAFWDWHGRMGGDCSAETLATRGEPMMRGDRVHFTSAGADWIGGLLADDLIGAYDAWKAGRAGGR